MRKNSILLFTILVYANTISAQWNFTFNYNSAGQRVALVEATVSETIPSISLHFIDSAYNNSNSFEVYKRPLHGNGVDWVLQTSLSAGTGTWTDLNVNIGDVWEYQVKRDMGTKYATGYISAGIRYDQSDYKGRMILLIDSSMITPLEVELNQLKKDLTGEGWFVEEIYAPRANGWYSGDTVVQVKQQIQNVWNTAPVNDKPTHLFIIGHVPVPRSGLDLQAPDGHANSNGAVGSDTYYADLDGIYTDDSTYAPSLVLFDPNAYNAPNDFKWDQDIIPSELELAFGRIDFFEIGSYTTSEEQLLRNYLNRLHDYRYVVKDMGEKTAFNLGYANSYDGSYRSLIPISGADSVYLTSGVTNYPEWVKGNGPFQAMLRNIGQPVLSNWDTYGMDATIFASDQSYWGQWSMAETGGYFATIRALLAADTKCLVALWQSTAVNVFYQSGIGETMGMSCKRIMDHNIINNNIEKPEQSYDESNFWNRTHMQYHGDPSVRLFQVYPISDLTEAVIGSNQLQLNWTASIEDSIVGYHVYKSTTEFGQYQKISNSLVTGTTFADVNVINSNDWYMVRAIKLQVTGSGTYLNPSIGVFIQSSLVLGVNKNLVNSRIRIYPNPTTRIVFIEGDNIKKIEVVNINGQIIKSIKVNAYTFDLSNQSKGIYFIKVITNEGIVVEKLILK